VPDIFHRIHHLDFLANPHCTEKLALCPVLLAATAAPDEPSPPRSLQDRLRDLTAVAIDLCPCCAEQMGPCGILPRRPPPRPTMWCDSS